MSRAALLCVNNRYIVIRSERLHMSDTKIEWTDKVWNPTTGCRPYSSGCANCYAQVQSHIRGANQHPAMVRKYHGLTVLNSHKRPVFTGEVRCHEEDLLAPLKVKKPTTWFVNSMSDLFYGDEADRRAAEKGERPFTPVPFSFVCKVFAVMALTPWHTYQILTKRAERLAEFMLHWRSPIGFKTNENIAWEMTTLGQEQRELVRIGYAHEAGKVDSEKDWPLPNVWLGVSVEDQKAANERIPHLLKVPAAVRFLSCEPLLGPVELSDVSRRVDAIPRLGKPALLGIDWVIAGGESGHGARPAHPDWFRSLRDQCQAAKVPFFFKQWGDWGPLPPQRTDGTWDRRGECVLADDGTLYRHEDLAYPSGARHAEAIRKNHGQARLTTTFRVGKKKAGRLLDGREWNEMPPRAAV